MSNGLDPDQDRRSVGPDPGSNSLQRLSADDIIVPTSMEWVKYLTLKAPIIQDCSIRQIFRVFLNFGKK